MILPLSHALAELKCLAQAPENTALLPLYDWIIVYTHADSVSASYFGNPVSGAVSLEFNS